MSWSKRFKRDMSQLAALIYRFYKYFKSWIYIFNVFAPFLSILTVLSLSCAVYQPDALKMQATEQGQFHVTSTGDQLTFVDD